MVTTTTSQRETATATTTKTYTVVILRAGPNRHAADAEVMVEEHGRRVRQLRADGLLSIHCAVADDTDVESIGIFDLGTQRTRDLMDVDPSVQAGTFAYEVHPVRGRPGDGLPG